MEAGRLRVVDLATGERLLTPVEGYAAQRAEATASRVAEVEAELECLRAEPACLRREA